MNRQAKAASAILTAFLLLVLLLNIVLITGFYTNLIRGDQVIGMSLLAVLEFPFDPNWISGVLAILSIGSAYVASDALPEKPYNLIVALAVGSTLATLIVMIGLSSQGIAPLLYNYATEMLADAESFRSAVYKLFGGTLGWLIVTIGTFVGVRNLGGNLSLIHI